MSSRFESALKAGYTDLSGRQLSDALAHFRTATEMAPDNPQGWAALAHTQLLMGQPQVALQSLTKSGKSTYALNLRAQCLQSMQLWDEALEVALESRRLDPRQPHLDCLLSELYWSRSRGTDLADMRHCLAYAHHPQAFRKVVLASSPQEALALLQRYPQGIDYELRELQSRLFRKLGRHFEHLAVRAASGHWPDWESWDAYLDSLTKIEIPKDLEQIFGREPILGCLRRPEQPSRCPTPQSGGWSGSHWRQNVLVNFLFYADRLEVKSVRDVPRHYLPESPRAPEEAPQSLDAPQPCLGAEYDVFRAVIPEGGVTRQRTIVRPPGRSEVQRLPGVDATTVENFLKRSQVSGWLEAELGRPILSEEEDQDIFSQGEGWDEFYRRHRGGIYKVSRVGFSDDGQQALVVLGHQTHWTAGHGQLMLLRRKDGAWLCECATNLWIS